MGGFAIAKEVRWDPSVYDSLAPAGSLDLIKPGTKITLRNWQQYKPFLPYGIQVQYSGGYFWHVGSDPSFTITVGPTQSVKLPKQFRMDTEKYGGQAKLEKVDTGGYTIKGYVAGVPFPNPAEPEVATKILYNARYPASPAVSLSSSANFLVDRYLNVGPTGFEVEYFRLSHLSVAGMPINPSYGKGYEYALRILQRAPEQAKYLTSLNLWPDDPSLPQEVYLFVPSLRRPLRLSLRRLVARPFLAATGSTTTVASSPLTSLTNSLARRRS